MRQLDISVIYDLSKLDDKGCKDAPELVIEILRTSTAKKDRVSKLDIYKQLGVKEYWLVSREDKTVEVYTL
jgi:Uma2 family endonuclease